MTDDDNDTFGNMGSAYETLRRTGVNTESLEKAVKKTRNKRELFDQQMGVISRARMVCALPLTKTKKFVRSNEKIEMKLVCWDQFGEPAPTPYGKPGRLIWAWLDSQICYYAKDLARNNYTLELEQTANELAGLILHGDKHSKVSGKQIQDFISNWNSISRTVFSVELKKKTEIPSCENTLIVEKQELSFRQKHNKIVDRRKGYIRFSKTYVEHVLGNNPPINMTYYASLTSVVEMDIYAVTNCKLRAVEDFKTKVSLNKNDLFMEIGPIIRTKLSAKKFFSKFRSVWDKYKNADDSPFEGFDWTETESSFVILSGKSNVPTREERRKFRAFDQVRD